RARCRGGLRSSQAAVPCGARDDRPSGPLAGAAGKPGRQALATAIERNAVVDAVCSAGTTCMAATGGVLSKGLAGYLGDGADVNAKFDPTAARSEYKAWDPTGSKVKNLSYTYDP